MKSLFVFFAFVFLLTMDCSAQVYSREQIQELIQEKESQNGIQEIETLLKLSKAYINFQLDTAVMYAQIARQKSFVLGHKWGYAKSMYHLTLAKMENQSIKSTIRQAKLCSDWFAFHNYEEDALYAKLLYAHCLFELKGNSHAYRETEKILERAKAINHSNLIGRCWFDLYKYKPALMADMKYPHAVDSAIKYLSISGDSLNLLEVYLYHTLPVNGNPEAFRQSYNAEKIAQRWENNRLLFRANMYIGLGYAGKRNIDTCSYYFDQSIFYAELLNSSYLRMQGIQEKSYGFFLGQSFQISNKYSEDALKTCQKYSFDCFTAMITARMGSSYKALGKNELAIEFILQAIEMLRVRKDIYSLYASRYQLARLYQESNQTDKAKSIYFQILEQSNQPALGSLKYQVLMGIYSGLGKIHQQEGESDSAIFYFEKATHFDEFAKDRFSIYARLELINAYLNVNNSTHTKKADSLYTITNKRYSQNIKNQSINFHLVSGKLAIRKQDYIEGIALLNDFLNKTGKKNTNQELEFVFKELYNGYKAIGQSGKALEAYEAYTTIKDSLNADKALNKVIQIQSRYELAIREDKIKDLQKQQELQELRLEQQHNQLKSRNIYLFFLGFILILVASIGYLLFRRYRQKKEQEEIEMNAKKTALELENLQARQKAEIAEVKNVLFSNISHEFRTPLTLIQVPVEQLIKTASSQDKPAFESILKNADQLLKMVDELLDLGKMETGKIELNKSIFSLESFFLGVSTYFQPLFKEKAIHFVLIHSFQNEEFEGDEKRLRIVMNNILKNAYNHTSEGGKVEVKAIIFNEKNKKGIRIEVFNSGAPIAPGDLPYIFDRYYRADEEQYTGYGIGLSLTKQIVELHEGTIGVLANEKQGVTFCVVLPGEIIQKEFATNNSAFEKKSHLELALPEMNFDHPTINQESAPKLLIVEDNSEMQELLYRTLKSDFRLTFAANGEIGVEQAMITQPELILSDIMMPKMDGMELLRIIKSDFTTSHIPIILLSAKADLESRLQGFNLDADDYISKPFHSDELIVRIHNILRQRKRLQKHFMEKPFVPKVVEGSTIDTEFMNGVRKILEKEYTNGDFTVQRFCKALALNRNSVHNKLKALTGQSASEYIKNFRLEKAVLQLLQTTDPITNVFIDNGFNSPQTFNRAFKEKFNCTPTQFRSKKSH